MVVISLVLCMILILLSAVGPNAREKALARRPRH